MIVCQISEAKIHNSFNKLVNILQQCTIRMLRKSIIETEIARLLWKKSGYVVIS